MSYSFVTLSSRRELPRKKLTDRQSLSNSSARMGIIQLTRRSNKLRVVAPPRLLAENVSRTLTVIIQLKLLLLCQLPVTQLQAVGNSDPDNQSDMEKADIACFRMATRYLGNRYKASDCQSSCRRMELGASL